MKRSVSVPVFSLTALATIACMLAWLHLVESAAAARDAAENLARIEAYEAQILVLRNLDSNAHLVGEQPTEATGAWVELAKSAGISEKQLIEINRLPLSKIEKTAYSRDDVFIRLDAVTAEQVVKFCLLCSNASFSYSPLSVQFSATRASVAEGKLETWNTTLVLTRILYTATNET
ncbi:MAG: hypothetical protein R3C53_19380 [Pirellulaceae bacterium]